MDNEVKADLEDAGDAGTDNKKLSVAQKKKLKEKAKKEAE